MYTLRYAVNWSLSVSLSLSLSLSHSAIPLCTSFRRVEKGRREYNHILSVILHYYHCRRWSIRQNLSLICIRNGRVPKVSFRLIISCLSLIASTTRASFPPLKTLETLGELLLGERARAAEAETGSAGSTSTYCILTINTFLLVHHRQRIPSYYI